ncbi:ComEC/Rec2 family competence protein [uncultured Pseudokineococcus sp.]|uniref:ComEC/Rec2 family competence protein n=1 Tax=uncultured Pseudokineococcus sp. TaxID=1642928 RepID=UPI00260846B0|nr:ComEC/Rec2 family competence protein [uncultured Pseudokineococcus sp.]
MPEPAVHRDDLRLVPAAAGAWGGAAVAVGAPARLSLLGALALVVLALVVLAVVLLRCRGCPGEGGARGPAGAARGRAAVHPRAGALALVAVVTAGAVTSAGLRTAEASAGLLTDLVERRAVAQVLVRVAADPSPVRAPAVGHGSDPGAADGTGDDEAAGGSSPERWVVRVAALQVLGRGAVAEARGRLLLVGGPAVAGLRRDERVEVVGRLQPTEAGDDVVAVLRVQGPVRARAAPDGWRGRAADLRAGLREAVEPLPRDARGLLPGLVVGDTSALPPDLEEAMRAAGLAHLTAVSGGNTAVLVGAVLGAAALLGARRGLRAALAALALAAFVAVAGPDPSVLRAGVMAATALVGMLAARPGRGVPPLAAAVVVLVVLDPWASRSVGFALSVLGTGALLVLARPWADALARVLPPRAAVVVAVPLAAQAVCAPVLLLLDPRVSVVAVPANLLAAPAVAPATVLGVVALAAAPASPALAQLLAVPAGWAAGWVALVARAAAALPGATAPWPGGWPGAALLAAALLGALVLLPAALAVARTTVRAHGDAAADGTAHRDGERSRPRAVPRVGGLPARTSPSHRSSPGRSARGGSSSGRSSPGRSRSGRSRSGRSSAGRRRALVAAAAVACLVVAAALWPPTRSRLGGGAWPPADWVAVQCDVGQGSALAVRSGPDAAVVVDAGPDPGAVRGCLDRLGVARVDLLVLSHFHADHVDGLEGVLDARDVVRALVSPLPVPAPASERVGQQLAEAGVPVAVGAAGAAGGAGDVAWRVLAPAPAGAAGAPAAATGSGEDDGANDASVVVALEASQVRLVVLGDLGAQAQAALRRATAADPSVWPVDVLGVAHHGSSDQDPGLAQLAAPRAALVGVGENTYGHPTDRALELVGAGGALVACTSVSGEVAVSGPPDALVLTPRRTGSGGQTC